MTQKLLIHTTENCLHIQALVCFEDILNKEKTNKRSTSVDCLSEKYLNVINIKCQLIKYSQLNTVFDSLKCLAPWVAF